MTTNEAEMTVSELLGNIEQGWQALNDALSQFSDAEITAADPEGGWSIKDHLAHLTAWEAGMVEVLRHGNRAAGMGLTADEWQDLSMDQMNDAIVERSRAVPLDEIRARFANVQAEMVAAVKGMSDEDLQRGYNTFQPDATGDSAANPIVGRIIGNTYHHFADHLQYLEGRLAARN